MKVKFEKGWGFIRPGFYELKTHRLGWAVYKVGVPNQVMPVDIVPGSTLQRLIASAVVVEDAGLGPTPELSNVWVMAGMAGVAVRSHPGMAPLEERSV